MKNNKNIFLGGLTYYEGHLYDVKELYDNCELVVIQGVEEKYNKIVLAHINELSSAYMCDPNKQVYKFNLNDYKCTINNGEIVLEKL